MGTIQTAELVLLTASDFDLAYVPIGGCATTVTVNSGTVTTSLDAKLYGEVLYISASSSKISLYTDNVQMAEIDNNTSYPFTCEIVCSGSNIAIIVNGDVVDVVSNISLQYNNETGSDMPDYTHAMFVETNNSVLQTMKTIFGDRPITISAANDGSVRVYLTPEYVTSTIQANAIASLSLRKASAIPARARIMSYKVTEVDIDDGDILGTAIVRMNCDANHVGYAKRAIYMKFAERIGISVQNEHIFDIGDTISASVTSQVTGETYSISGEIVSASISPVEDRYVIIRHN